jgi:hypothetical protein
VAGRIRRPETPAQRFEADAATRLPVDVPEVYALHSRVVDIEGLIHLHTNRYSVDEALIGRRVEVRETLARVRIFVGPREITEHARLEEGAHGRSVLPEHRHRAIRCKIDGHCPPLPEEKRLCRLTRCSPPWSSGCAQRHGGRPPAPCASSIAATGTIPESPCSRPCGVRSTTASPISLGSRG